MTAVWVVLALVAGVSVGVVVAAMCAVSARDDSYRDGWDAGWTHGVDALRRVHRQQGCRAIDEKGPLS